MSVRRAFFLLNVILFIHSSLATEGSKVRRVLFHTRKPCQLDDAPGVKIFLQTELWN